MKTLQASFEFLKNNLSIVLPNLIAQLIIGGMTIIGMLLFLFVGATVSEENFVFWAILIILSLLVLLVLVFVQLYIFGGTLGLIKRIYKKEEVKWTQFLSEGKKHFGRVLGVSTLVGLLVIFAVCLIYGAIFYAVLLETIFIPVLIGILGYVGVFYTTILCYFSIVIIIEEKVGIVEAAKMTFKVPASIVFKMIGLLFLFVIAVALFSIVTAFVPPISMIISFGIQIFMVPFILIYVYLEYLQHKKTT